MYISLLFKCGMRFSILVHQMLPHCSLWILGRFVYATHIQDFHHCIKMRIVKYWDTISFLVTCRQYSMQSGSKFSIRPPFQHISEVHYKGKRLWWYALPVLSVGIINFQSRRVVSQQKGEHAIIRMRPTSEKTLFGMRPFLSIM